MTREFYQQKSFLCLDGPAKQAGREFSQVKVCFTCRDQNLLRNLLMEIAQLPECYWVKMSVTPKDEMYLGRCFFTTKEVAGQIWAYYKSHDRLMVNIQDDDFASKFRPK